MPIKVVAEREYLVGQSTVVEGAAPSGHFVAVFEDDGETGYFYALDTSEKQQPIQDAVLVYNVANVTDGAKPSTVKVGWSGDNMKAVLLINGHPHAVFNFQTRQGFCRSGFPSTPSNARWSTQGHAWSDSAIEFFA